MRDRSVKDEKISHKSLNKAKDADLPVSLKERQWLENRID